MPAALLLLLSVAPGAHAQEEVCDGPLLIDAWREAMDGVDQAVAKGNGALADRILADLTDLMRCLERPAAPGDLGRLARQLSLVAFYAQDTIEVERWAQLAHETVGLAPWPEVLPAPQRYHDLVAELPPPERAGPADRGLAPPKKGAVLLDGRLALEPVATVDVPHLVQLADRKGRVVLTDWQDGAAFAEEVLGDPSTPSTPGWYQPPPPPIASETPNASVEDAEVSFDEEQVERACAWKGGVRKVDISARTVTVNKQSFPVGKRADQDTFKQVLRDCGEFRAARRFVRWRRARRALRFDARSQRDRMESALYADEPTRKRQRR